MSRDPDDDALRWAGDDDPTLAPGSKAVGTPGRVNDATRATDARTSADVTGDAAAPESGAAAASDEAQGDATAGALATTGQRRSAAAAAQAGSAELVVLGVLGGVYLLYSIAWLIWATTPAPELGDPVAQFMFGLGRWFAVLAPALWFVAVLWLAAGRRRARLLWLIAGAVVLVPVPFLLRG